jgi:hypothetical protein
VLGPERLQGRFADPDALGLEQVVGQLGVGPVGPVEPLLGWPVDDPLAEGRGQVGGQLGFGPLGLAWLELVQAAGQVGVEPALGRPRGGPGVGSDLRVLAAPVGHQDNLDAVPEGAIGGRLEQAFQLANLGVGQGDADHEPVLGGSKNPAEDNLDTINRIVNQIETTGLQRHPCVVPKLSPNQFATPSISETTVAASLLLAATSV